MNFVKRLISSFFILFLIVACSSPQPQSSFNEDIPLTIGQQKDFLEAKNRIGKTYWADHIEVCNAANLMECEFHRYRRAIHFHNSHHKDIPEEGAYGPFKVIDVINSNSAVNDYYVITDAEGETKYIPLFSVTEETFLNENPSIKRAQAEAKRKKKNIEAKAECDRKGGVSVGMTKEQVLASCWGKPQKKNITETGNGIHEQWVYGFDAYVYFDGDVVTGVQASQ